MSLLCQDIPKLPGLESIRLRGGSAAVANPVRWPYVAENRSFRDWVRGGELVFVTGISRHRSPQNLAECLYEGQDCRIAGLVVLTGDAYIGQLPNALSRLADELSLPLFEQPYSLPMVQVTETIGRAIVWSERSSGQASELATASTVPELLEAWIACRGNHRAMAERLGCHRNTVHNRMNQLVEALPEHQDRNEGFKSLLLAHLMAPSQSARREHD